MTGDAASCRTRQEQRRDVRHGRRARNDHNGGGPGSTGGLRGRHRRPWIRHDVERRSRTTARVRARGHGGPPGRPAAHLLASELPFAMRRHLAAGEPWTSDLTLRNRDGDRGTVRLRGTPLSDAYGRTLSWCGSLMSVSLLAGWGLCPRGTCPLADIKGSGGMTERDVCGGGNRCLRRSAARSRTSRSGRRPGLRTGR